MNEVRMAGVPKNTGDNAPGKSQKI